MMTPSSMSSRSGSGAVRVIVAGVGRAKLIVSLPGSYWEDLLDYRRDIHLERL